MKKKIGLVIFIFISFLTAQNLNILEQVRDKFNSAATISADISQLTGNNKLSGKLFYKKDNKFRLEFKNLSIISDGLTIWNYNKAEKKVIISEMDESNPSTVSIDKILNEYPEKSDVSVTNEKGKNIILLTRKKDSRVNFDKIRLWVNDENLVERINILQAGAEIEINISNYKFNQEIQESQFLFTPPQGTQVIDLR